MPPLPQSLRLLRADLIGTLPRIEKGDIVLDCSVVSLATPAAFAWQNPLPGTADWSCLRSGGGNSCLTAGGTWPQRCPRTRESSSFPLCSALLPDCRPHRHVPEISSWTPLQPPPHAPCPPTPAPCQRALPCCPIQHCDPPRSLPCPQVWQFESL